MKTRPANDRARAIDATELYDTSGIDWSVSADETLRAYGYIGKRRAHSAVDLWTMPGVRPKIATTGIRVGDTIELSDGSYGEVTRVGTIAGWFIHSSSRLESRWSIEEVDNIVPAERSTD